MRQRETSVHFPPELQPNSSGPSTVSSHGRRARGRQIQTQGQWITFYKEDHGVTLPTAHRCIWNRMNEMLITDRSFVRRGHRYTAASE